MPDLGQIGIMNALRTGNVFIDMVLAMLVPVAINMCMKWNERGVQYFKELFAGKYTVRRVVVTEETGWKPQPREMAVLQKAMMSSITRNGFVTKHHGELSLVGCTNFSNLEHAGTLRKLVLGVLPSRGTWATVSPGVEFFHDEQRTRGDKMCTTTTTYKVRGHDCTVVDKWVAAAFTDYIDTKVDADEDVRYMYMRVRDKDADRCRYKRYALSESKTFDSIFSPIKRDVIRLVDDFSNKAGRFSNASIPHKLGILLHGPPGTGKTSMIKALAHYTKRHIVSIPLADIETNSELTRMMFDQEYPLGDYFKARHPFSDTIYVIEDVDAATKVVLARKEEEDDSATAGTKQELKREVEKAVKSALVAKKDVKDALNLAGLLNVIDGVIDTPGRILVMTTNHPEKLDPALIRPGRVNMQIHLGYMKTAEIVDMVEFYIGPVTREQLDSIQSSCREFTPAQVEQKCMVSDTVDAFIASLL